MSTDGGGFREIVFMLVHGTFADRTPWVDDGSPGSFRARLAEALGPSHDVRYDAGFSWGASSFWRFLSDNRIAARLRGGERLRDRIRAFDKQPGSSLYLLAHSHGGNVAMYALRDQQARAKVDGVVTMGTPFLVSELAEDRWGLTGFVAIVLLVVAIDLGNVWFWAYTALFWLVAITIRLIGKDPAGQLDRLALPASEIREQGAPRLLVIHTRRDEAYLLLRVAEVAARFVRFLWSGLIRGGNWVVGVLVVLIFARWGIDWLTGDDTAGWAEDLSLALDRFVATPILVATSVVMMAVVVLRLSYAFDGAPWITSIDTDTATSPWPDAEERELPRAERGGGLHHTNVPARAVGVIAGWVDAGEADHRA